MKWRTHNEKPDTSEPVTALLAMPDDEGEHQQPILLGMYLWRRGKWITENEGTPAVEPYWWVLESDVAATIARPEGGVITVPADLFHKILGQHRLAATALIDGHGDIHRAIVREMESFEPQSGSK